MAVMSKKEVGDSGRYPAVKRFRGGLVFKTDRRCLNSRLEIIKKMSLNSRLDKQEQEVPR
jgi:hypothetical protein